MNNNRRQLDRIQSRHLSNSSHSVLIEKHSESLKHLISQEKMTTHQFINRQSFNLCYCHVFGSTSGKKYCIVHTKKDFD